VYLLNGEKINKTGVPGAVGKKKGCYNRDERGSAARSLSSFGRRVTQKGKSIEVDAPALI